MLIFKNIGVINYKQWQHIFVYLIILKTVHFTLEFKDAVRWIWILQIERWDIIFIENLPLKTKVELDDF